MDGKACLHIHRINMLVMIPSLRNCYYSFHVGIFYEYTHKMSYKIP